MVKNQGTKQRVQRILGDHWQWESNGQCVKGDNCSFRHDMNKRGKVTPSNPSPNSFLQQNAAVERLDGLASLRGTCNNSFCEKWHPPECLFYKTKSGCRFGEKCSFAHRQVDEQPNKRSQKNGEKSAVAMLKKHESYELGCVFQDMEPPRLSSILTEEFRHAETNPTCKIHETRCMSRKNSRPKSFARKYLPR